MTAEKHIVLIDDEIDVVEAVSEMLELEGFSVTAFTDPNLGLKSLKANSQSVVLCDVRMPQVDGLTLLSSIQHRAANVPVLLMSGHGDIPMAIEAMKLGAFDFLEKPLNVSELVEKLDLALAQSQHNCPAATDGDEETELPIETVVIGQSKAMDTIRKQVLALSHTGVDTIINGGTLFLDEIESMPIAVQIKLLRVIQERMIERVGGNELIPVDIVVVAASKADLASLSETGEFRADLFYRLNIASLNLPALRQRKEDIQVLFRHFVIQASHKYKTRPSTIYPEQIQQLCRHEWPGNVRELRNVADRFVLGIVGDGFDLQSPICESSGEDFAFEKQMEQYERNVLTEALIESAGNINEVSSKLNLPRKTLYRKMKKHQLDKESFKA